MLTRNFDQLSNYPMTEVLVDLTFLIGLLSLSACVIVFVESTLNRQ
jgi:hypothetical protein